MDLGPVTALRSRRALIADYWEWDRLSREMGWTDGIPTAPPTDARVEELIAATGRDGADEIALVAPGNGVATIEQVAIQCAMAACRPVHMPIVLAAIDALTDPNFNLHGVQSTTNPCAPLIIVGGPIVEAAEINVGNGAFGGGGFGNAAIGRAVRLILWNLGNGKPTTQDMSPLGHPAKYSFCVAENRTEGPWSPLLSDFGFTDEDDAVLAFACNGPWPAMVNGSAERILALLAHGMTSATLNAYHAAGQILVVLSVRPAVELANAGYTRHDVRRHLFEHARFRVGDLRRRGILDGPLSDTSMVYWGQASLAEVTQDLTALPDDAMVPLLRSDEDVLVMVTGGDNQWWAGYCQGWGAYGGQPTAKPIR